MSKSHYSNALARSGSERISAFLDQNPIWLAPMAGVNDACFRGICKQMGAGITYTEMISATGLHYNYKSEASQRLLQLSPHEAPVAVQLFGADPEIIAQQARAVVRQLGENLAFIDINMGCPVSKVIKKGEGSALMTTPEVAAKIISYTVEALKGQGCDGSDIPVTAKFRRGFDEQEADANLSTEEGREGFKADAIAVEFAQLLESAGARALAVHGRYQSQFYSGHSNRDTITRVARAVSIPVIGSGDIFTPEDALAMITPVKAGGAGARGVMIARGAQGNPWIFKQIQQLQGGQQWSKPCYEEVFDIMRQHARCIEKTFGSRALVRMRKHAMWYCAGLPGASYFRREMNSLSSLSDLESLIDRYRLHLREASE